MTNQAAQTMPALPHHKGFLFLHNQGGVSQVWGYTADQMYQYARDYAAALSQPAGVAEPHGKLVGWWNGIKPDVTERSPYGPSVRWGADAEDRAHDIPLYDGYNPVHFTKPTLPSVEAFASAVWRDWMTNEQADKLGAELHAWLRAHIAVAPAASGGEVKPEPSPKQCRERLMREGKPHPRSGCVVCKTGGLTGCPYEKAVHEPQPPSGAPQSSNPNPVTPGLSSESGASVSERARAILSQAYREAGFEKAAEWVLQVDLDDELYVLDRAVIRAIERALSSPRQEGEAIAWIFYFKDDDGEIFVRLCHSRSDIERAIINDWWSGDDAVADDGERMAPHIADDLIRTGVFHAEDGSCYAQNVPAPPGSTAASTQGEVVTEPGAIRALVTAANAVLALHPEDDGMWTLEMAVRPFNATKPAECANGCPANTVCDYCQIAALTEAKQQGLGEAVLSGKYGDVLRPFVIAMDKELHANAGKGDRPGWLRMTPETALLEIYYHLSKLQKAVRDDNGPGIQEYAADVANMSMMLLDICGGLALIEYTAPQVEAKRQTGEGECPKFAVGDRVTWTNKFGTSFPGVIEECWSGPVRYCVALDDGTIAGVAYESEIAAAAKPSGEGQS